MTVVRADMIAIGLWVLLIPFSVADAQFTIHSSEGVTVVGKPTPSDSSGHAAKGETWIRVYAPGEQEREQRQAVEQQRSEQQQKAAPQKKEESSVGEKETQKTIIVNTQQPVVTVPAPVVGPRPPIRRPPIARPY
jgi:hypothetical protein